MRRLTTAACLGLLIAATAAPAQEGKEGQEGRQERIRALQVQLQEVQEALSQEGVLPQGLSSPANLGTPRGARIGQRLEELAQKLQQAIQEHGEDSDEAAAAKAELEAFSKEIGARGFPGGGFGPPQLGPGGQTGGFAPPGGFPGGGGPAGGFTPPGGFPGGRQGGFPGGPGGLGGFQIGGPGDRARMMLDSFGRMQQGGGGFGGENPAEMGQRMVLAGLEVQLGALADSVRSAEDEGSKERLTADLRELAETLIGIRDKQRNRQIEQLEARLEELRGQSESAESADAMIERLLSREQAEAEAEAEDADEEGDEDAEDDDEATEEDDEGEDEDGDEAEDADEEGDEDAEDDDDENDDEDDDGEEDDEDEDEVGEDAVNE